MRSYLFILFLVRTILVAERVSGSLHGKEITKDLGDFADVASEYPIEEGNDEEKWQLINRPINRNAEGSSFHWEHVTDDDCQEASGGGIISAEVEADPMICEICEHEMADSKPIHSKTALSCGHLFHSACIPHTSRNWGYDCPLCQGPSEITRARHEWQQQQCAKVFACSLFFLGFYLLALSIALGQ